VAVGYIGCEMSMICCSCMSYYKPEIRIRIRIRALLARYVYTYKEFVIVTEAPQCNKMTVTGQQHRQQTNNIQIYKQAMHKMAKTIYNTDNYV